MQSQKRKKEERMSKRKERARDREPGMEGKTDREGEIKPDTMNANSPKAALISDFERKRERE